MQRGDVHWLAKPDAQIRQSLTPVLCPRRQLHRVVVTVDPRIILLHLQPAARLEILKRLAIQLRPICRAAAKRSPVYEIEFAVSKFPGLLEIVDIELQVGRYVTWLDG